MSLHNFIMIKEKMSYSMDDNTIVLCSGESQLMRPIGIIVRPRRISNDAWILRSRRKLFVWKKKKDC